MLTIRAATVDDADPIAAVHVKTWQAAYAGVMPQGFLDGLDVAGRTAMWRRAIGVGRPPGGIFLAEARGELVGFASVGTYRLPEGGVDPTVGEIFAIYVAPEHWSTGAGYALMRAAVDHLTEHGLREIRLWVLADNPRSPVLRTLRLRRRRADACRRAGRRLPRC
jgi:GNAT superfamily N-acetyltransferase